MASNYTSMKRVYFVGVHNKTGMHPLDSRTKSGKIIDRVIEQLPNIRCIKTNLYDVDYLPNIPLFDDVVKWSLRANNVRGDIIVLLGSCVRLRFGKWFENECHIIAVPHPSKVQSLQETELYINGIVQQIATQIVTAKASSSKPFNS